MQSRPLRLILGAVCLAAVAAAAFYVDRAERTIKLRRAALVSIDDYARDAIHGFADLRSAQQAYVAAGQGIGFWMPKVDEISERISAALMGLQQLSHADRSKMALEEAVAAFVEFGNVDKRIRGYLTSGSSLMAADIVFTEGVETAAKAGLAVEQARTEEHLAADALEAAQRKVEIYAAGGAAAVVVLIALALALMSGKSDTPAVPEPRQARESLPLKQAAARRDHDSPAPAAPPAAPDDLPLRREDRPEPKQDSAARAVDPPKPAAAAGPSLRAAAQVCTDLGRVSDPEELKALLGRAAETLDASGLMVWMGTGSGTELRAVVAHGYSPDMLARIPAVPRSANNAAATAYRTGTLQIILSRPGSTKGAVVAPVLSADGCIGVLSAEIRDGGEASDTVQALAAIFAAQLAGVLATSPSGGEQRVTAQG